MEKFKEKPIGKPLSLSDEAVISEAVETDMATGSTPLQQSESQCVFGESARTEMKKVRLPPPTPQHSESRNVVGETARTETKKIRPQKPTLQHARTLDVIGESARPETYTLKPQQSEGAKAKARAGGKAAAKWKKKKELTEVAAGEVTERQPLQVCFDMDAPENMEERAKMTKAATRIQSRYRGNKARQQAKDKATDQPRPTAKKKLRKKLGRPVVQQGEVCLGSQSLPLATSFQSATQSSPPLGQPGRSSEILLDVPRELPHAQRLGLPGHMSRLWDSEVPSTAQRPEGRETPAVCMYSILFLLFMDSSCHKRKIWIVFTGQFLVVLLECGLCIRACPGLGEAYAGGYFGLASFSVIYIMYGFMREVWLKANLQVYICYGLALNLCCVCSLIGGVLLALYGDLAVVHIWLYFFMKEYSVTSQAPNSSVMVGICSTLIGLRLVILCALVRFLVAVRRGDLTFKCPHNTTSRTGLAMSTRVGSSAKGRDWPSVVHANSTSRPKVVLTKSKTWVLSDTEDRTESHTGVLLATKLGTAVCVVVAMSLAVVGVLRFCVFPVKDSLGHYVTLAVWIFMYVPAIVSLVGLSGYINALRQQENVGKLQHLLGWYLLVQAFYKSLVSLALATCAPEDVWFVILPWASYSRVTTMFLHTVLMVKCKTLHVMQLKSLAFASRSIPLLLAASAFLVPLCAVFGGIHAVFGGEAIVFKVSQYSLMFLLTLSVQLVYVSALLAFQGIIRRLENSSDLFNEDEVVEYEQYTEALRHAKMERFSIGVSYLSTCCAVVGSQLILREFGAAHMTQNINAAWLISGASLLGLDSIANDIAAVVCTKKDNSVKILQTVLQKQMLRSARKVADDAKAAGDVNPWLEGFCFWFLDAGFIRDSVGPLPNHQELRRMEGWLSLERVDLQQILDGELCSNTASVSYCWRTREHPDPEGIQIDGLRTFLRSNLHIKKVWIDWVSLPQKPRSQEEVPIFDDHLKLVNMIYLSTTVIILMSDSYLTRFWPQFEAFLSFQKVTRTGLEPTPQAERRTHIIHATDSEEDQKAAEDWFMDFFPEATLDEMVTHLADPCCIVANGRDKLQQIAKLMELQEQVVEQEGVLHRQTFKKRCARTQAPSGRGAHGLRRLLDRFKRIRYVIG